MGDKVKLLTPEDIEAGNYTHAEQVALARWAALAHALLSQLHWYPDARILLDEIDTTETPNG